MNDQEAAKLLSLIKLSYPQSYRDVDRITASATVKMWAGSFASVPYAVMERAFDRFRMKSKFPPTVACLAQELKTMHFDAEDKAFAHRMLGNEEAVRKYRYLMACTAGFSGGLDGRGLENGQMGSAGASGNRLGLADGVPQLGAGEN